MKKTLSILSLLVLLGCNISGEKSDNDAKQIEQDSETEYVSEYTYSTETFQKILQQLKINSDECYLPLVVEKHFNKFSCWVVPITTSMEAENPYSFSLACHVLLVDRQTGTIVNKYYSPHTWISSNMRRLTKISIDNKPYQSDNNINLSIYLDNKIDKRDDNAIKSFFVMAHYEEISDVSTESSEEISLFVLQNKSLKKMFDYTSKIYGKKNCNGYDRIEKNLFISDNMTNGLFDMVMVTDSINMCFPDNDNPDKPYFQYDPDYKFFRYTGSKYEETTILNNTVVHIERFFCFGPASSFGTEIHYCFGKTLAQAYEICRRNMDFLKPKLPKEDISYSIPDDVDTERGIEIDYKYEKDGLYIDIYDGHSSGTIKITELDGYILVSSSWSD